MFDYSKVDWTKNGGKVILDLFSCAFNLEDNSSRVTFHIIAFNCNGTDLNCSADDIFNGPFTIMFNRPLILENVQEVEYDEEEPILFINGMQYRVVNSDFYYFIGDFQADDKEAHCNLIKHLAEYIKREYM